MPRGLISSAHEWRNEIITVNIYSLLPSQTKENHDVYTFFFLLYVVMSRSGRICGR